MTLPIGLVLAGGAGRRMGRSKGDLALDGCSLAVRAARTLETICGGVLISVRPGGDNPAPGFAAVPDSPPPGRGPLAGIDAAFRATDGGDLLVLACDYPRIDTEMMRRLLDRRSTRADLIHVAGADGRGHPLVGLWSRGVAAEVGRALEERRFKVRDLVDRVNALRIGPADFPEHDLERCLVNVNAPEDLESFVRD